MNHRRNLLAAGLAAALLAGCADDDDSEGPSKRDYISKANASCVKHGKEADAAFGRIIGDGRPTPAQAQRFLAQAVVPAMREGTAERAALPAPEGDEDEIRAINAAAKRAVARFEEIASDRSRSADLMRGQVADPAKRVDALNRRYGIDECGGGE